MVIAVPVVRKEITPGFVVFAFEPDGAEAESLAKLDQQRASGEAARAVRRRRSRLSAEEVQAREAAAVEAREAARIAREEAAALRRMALMRAREEARLERAVVAAEQRAIRAAKRAAKRAARTPEQIGPWEARRLRQGEMAVAVRDADREANRKFAERFRIWQLSRDLASLCMNGSS